MWRNSGREWAVLFSTVDLPVNQWFLICDFLLVYCSQSVMKVLLHRIGSCYVTYYGGDKLKSIHSKNFYKELDTFTTAFMKKMKRRKIYLFSGKYFEVHETACSAIWLTGSSQCPPKTEKNPTSLQLLKKTVYFGRKSVTRTFLYFGSCLRQIYSVKNNLELLSCMGTNN